MVEKRGKLFVVSAPSGAGKTTLVKEVLKTLKELDVERVVTFTSRKRSSGEESGVDYHFISQDDFESKIKQGFFIEYSTVYGAYYGFPKSALLPLDNGSSFIAIVDKNGAVSLSCYEPSAVLIRIDPPDSKSLQERLCLRKRESQEEIAFRLRVAEDESAAMKELSLFHYVIINNELSIALNELEAIIRKELLGLP